MSNQPSVETLFHNQDLLRASITEVDREVIERALLWLRGKQPYPFPTSIHLNLTLRCTARCVHCRQWTWPTHSEYTESQLERLFEIFQQWGVKTITLGGGNPLLHQHVRWALECAHNANLRIGIISEGIDLSDDLAAAIGKYAEWIRFSLDGPTPEIHDKIRNTLGLFSRVVDCVKIIQAQNSDVLIGINCVVQKRNIQALSKMLDIAGQLELDTLLFKLPHGDDNAGHFLLTQVQFEQFAAWVRTHSKKIYPFKTNLPQLSELLGSVFQSEDAAIGRPVRTFYKENQIRCFAPLLFLTCDSEGNLYPCDYLQADTRLWNGKHAGIRNEFRLGNILQDSEGALAKLADLLRRRIHNLPASGFDECGSCTRFCQLNAALTRIDQHFEKTTLNVSAIDEYIAQANNSKKKPTFL